MSDKYTFPRQIRLIKGNQFKAVLAPKSQLMGKYFVCYYLGNPLAYPRIGIITAKKSCRLAILRNRIKRQVRESFRHYQSKLPNYDMVVIARQGAQKASQSELRQCLDNLFWKLSAGLS